jgi:hypothetical protein
MAKTPKTKNTGREQGKDLPLFIDETIHPESC